MTLEEMFRALAADLALALGEAAAVLLQTQDLDAAYAAAIEKLSDQRLAKKSFPDGKYIPP